MDQYSPTHFSITISNPLEPKLDKLNNVGSDQEVINYQPHSLTDLKSVTKTITKKPKMKRNYVLTPNGLRLKLIEAVFKYGEQIKKAAYRLGINYSSAKSICQLYKREGRSARKKSRSWYSEGEKKVVFATCTNNPLEDSTKEEEETQNFSGNLTSWETSIRGSLLAIKDPVMRAYPTVHQTNKQAIASRIEEPQNGSRHHIFPQVQSLVSQHSRQKIYSQYIYPQIMKTTVPQQPLICPSIAQSTTQSSPIYPFSSDALLSLIPSVPMRVINSQSFTTPTYPPPQHQIAHVYIHAYPQNANIVNSPVGGAPILLRPVFNTKIQILNL